MSDRQASKPTESELLAEIDRERMRLRALQDISIALGSTLDLNEFLDVILNRITEVMEADHAMLFLLDEESGELTCTAPRPAAEAGNLRMMLGEGLPGVVAKTGHALNLPDAYHDARFDASWDRLTGYRTRSILCVPMRNQRGQTVGVVQVLDAAVGTFSESDEQLLTALASHAAVSIENSRLFLSVVGKNIELLDTKEELERKIQELDVLFEIAQVAASAIKLDDLLTGVLARTMRAIDAQAASILIADEVTGDLHFRAATGGEPERIKRMTIPFGTGISGWVAKNQRPQIVNNVDQDPRHSSRIADEVGYQPRSVLCVPLQWHENGRGALQLLNKGSGFVSFTEADLKLATVIAGHISTAIEHAQTRERRAREERLSTLGQFLSSMLHDLKTPLTVIGGYTTLMLDESDSEKRRGMSETIQRQIHAINTMTRETLEFAKGERTILIRKVYLYKYFEDLADQLRHELSDERVELELVLRDRGMARFDEEKMRRVFQNLSRNAAEAMNGRGGQCVLEVDRSDDGSLVLTFADDGPGVPENIRHRLFESFATHGKASGTGLGLAIVRQIMHDHSGSVSFQSEPGRTVFTMVIPQPTRDGGERGASSSGDVDATTQRRSTV